MTTAGYRRADRPIARDLRAYPPYPRCPPSRDSRIMLSAGDRSYSHNVVWGCFRGTLWATVGAAPRDHPTRASHTFALRRLPNPLVDPGCIDDAPTVGVEECHAAVRVPVWVLVALPAHTVGEEVPGRILNSSFIG